MPGKKKKPTKSESESEASEKEESEEEQEEGSEEEEEEDKGSDEEEDEEDEDEDEDKEESEESGEKSDKSGGSDDEDKSSKSSSSSSKSSKSGSSDGSKSDSDESDGSGKKGKKKKKDKKDKKDKDKGKKGKKGKEEPTVEPKKPSSKNELPPEPPKLTIASVFQDLDDLSIHLAKTFTSFNGEKEVKEVQKQPSPSPSPSPDRKNDSPLGLTNQRPPIHSATLPGGYGSKTQLKPLVDDSGVQCEPETVGKRQASPEAIRAVQEYKQRKEQERKRQESQSPEEPKAVKKESQVRQDKPRDNSQPKYRESHQEEYERVRREERKREQDNTIDFKRRTVSPKRTGPNWTRANQIAEDYYASLYKKSAKNPLSISGQKTVHDLYKYKPKPGFVEDDSQPIVQYDEGDFRRTRDQPTFDVYDPRLKQQNEYSYKYNPLNSNKKPLNDAMDVLAKKSRNNNKF